jgi:ClpA/ClpB-like protein
MPELQLADLVRDVQAHQPQATSPLTHLSSAVLAAGALNTLGDRLIDHFVQRARAAGCTWTDIGQCLGVSKQAAQKKHSERYAADRAAKEEPPRFDEFTPAARDCLEAAEAEARLLGHHYIGTEHVLLGLLADPGSTGRLLAEAGVGIEPARALAEQIVGRGAGAPAEPLPLTPRTYKTLELALREAERLAAPDPGPAHLLLGVLREGKGVGAQVLQALAGDPEGLREAASRADSLE